MSSSEDDQDDINIVDSEEEMQTADVASTEVSQMADSTNMSDGGDISELM